MARHDLLEARLTWILPYLACVVVVALSVVVQRPRPVLTDARRELAVGYPRGGSATVTDPKHPDALRPPLTRCGLFDLARSDAKQLQLLQGGRVDRSAVGFEPDAVTSYLKRYGMEPTDTDLEVDVLFPNPGGNAATQMVVLVHAYRLLPPASWDIFFYDLATGEPKLLLARRDEPERLRLGRTADERLCCDHEALTRHNRRLVFSDGTWHEVRAQRPLNAWLLRVGGAFCSAAWWGWLAMAFPLVVLALSAAGRARRARSIMRRTGRHEAVTAGLLVGLLAVGAALAAAAAMRGEPTCDALTALLAPVLVAAALWLGVVVAEVSAARYAG